MNRICILGAGNLGIALAVYLINKDIDVNVITNKDELSDDFVLIDRENNINLSAKIKFTSDYQSIDNCDMLVVTYPTFMIADTIFRLAKYKIPLILFCPGYGQKDRYCDVLVKNGTIVAGFDRVPFIARVDKNICIASRKPSTRLGCIPNEKSTDLCAVLSSLLDMKIIPLPNYETVNFTPSNPILHTARLYSIFKSASLSTHFPKMIKFYREWDDESSEVLLNMDSELEHIISEFKDVDLSYVIPLKRHYESYTISDMTKKISTIQSLSNIDSPLIKLAENDYVIDIDSRYFKEDFDFGLKIIKSYAVEKRVPTPTIDMVLEWYDNLVKQ